MPKKLWHIYCCGALHAKSFYFSFFVAPLNGTYAMLCLKNLVKYKQLIHETKNHTTFVLFAKQILAVNLLLSSLHRFTCFTKTATQYSIRSMYLHAYNILDWFCSSCFLFLIYLHWKNIGRFSCMRSLRVCVCVALLCIKILLFFLVWIEMSIGVRVCVLNMEERKCVKKYSEERKFISCLLHTWFI